MGVLAWIFAVIGAVLGSDGSEGLAGLLVGAASGFALGWLVHLASRVKMLERRMRQMEQQRQAAMPPTRQSPPLTSETVAPHIVAPPESRAVAISAKPPAITESATAPGQAREPQPIRQPVAPNPLVEAVRRFFTDGNVVVRVGIIVLFFGVAFLLKFAIDRQLLPIELRLTAAALGGIGLISLGWHLRLRRTAYALLIQGGGIGIFYLTVYAAAKLYHLLPLGFALLMMVAVVVLSSLLALWQNSRALAAFGIAGGFLAPVLTSSGGGSHVLLFSYYALLNAGILGIAWYRAWRELNLLGFLFTFVIGTAWGLNYYHPHHFNTTEPFLILFFLFYVAIALLFALRQPLRLRGYVDGTLVFGVPIVGFALQSGLVHDHEYGMAMSAFVLGGFYIALASLLWRRQLEGMRLLTESFLALGVVFATLAIPLALDGRWTAAAWALEGAALVWVGIRQSRLLARLTGLILQLGAGVFFLGDLQLPYGELPILNSIFLGATLISLAALFTAWHLYHRRAALRTGELWIEYAMLGWGLAWWFVFGANEIDRHVGTLYAFNATLLFIVASAAALLAVWRLATWPTLRYPLLALLPVAAVMSLEILLGSQDHFFANLGWLSWLLLFVVQYRLLWRMEGEIHERLVASGHTLTLWLLLALLSHELAWATESLLNAASAWQAVAWVVAPLLVIVLIGEGHWRPSWPIQRFASTYQISALLPVALALLLWNLLTLQLDGDPSPVPFVPLFNPLELTQLLVLMAVGSWWWHYRNSAVMQEWQPDPRLPVALLGVLTFVWLNGVIAHAIHHFAGVPYRLDTLHHSLIFQTALSVTWTVVALLVMVMATRTHQRLVWMAGALLLGLVVMKLFFIDLAKSGSVERIVSFIVVGGLMLVIGYFSPLPPKREGSEP
ncbi:MAG TPA: DUF2339 domain-containing protein [Gammaproteobacteria bacterium]